MYPGEQLICKGLLKVGQKRGGLRFSFFGNISANTVMFVFVKSTLINKYKRTQCIFAAINLI